MFCLLIMKLSAWWFNRRSGWCSKRSGFSINILIRIGCHTWDYHVGATINTCFTWCWTIFLKTFFIIKKGGKALRYWLDQICCIALVLWLYGFGVPWNSREAKRSISGFPLIWQILWHTCGRSFHSEWSFQIFDCQSTSTFMDLGKYSTVILIPWCRTNFLC